MADIGNFGTLWRYADISRALGSPFVASVLEAGERQLWHAPKTAALISDWTGDSGAAAVAMRFNGAIHALARQGNVPSLSALYQQEHQDFDAALRSALIAEDAFVAEWMRDPPQTNEVGRSASIASALMVARVHTGLPAELLELGSSCGLNLNLAHYSYDLGGLQAGVPASRVRVAPQWHGAPPPDVPLDVVSAKGVDLKPLDPTDYATQDRLQSFVWADQRDRADRLEQALAFAQEHRPQVDRGDAVHWLAEQLDLPQREGVCRTVFHSMVLQYLGDANRAAICDMIHRAGERATAERPLAWISFEWNPGRTEVQLKLSCWPKGETTLLAICHPYGDWIRWQA
ncbi:MAG TPA: DUF2332 family protein [Sphingobium sp.]